MRRASILALVACSLAACGRGCQSEPAKSLELQASATQQAYEDEDEQAYERLRPFDRSTLEVFPSDQALHRYFESIMSEQGPAPDGDAASHSGSPPSRMRVLGWTAGKSPPAPVTIQGAASYQTLHDERSRLVQRGDQIFSLYADRLRSFVIEPGTVTLSLRDSVTLGVPYPPIVKKLPVDAVDQQGRHVQVLAPDNTDWTGMVEFDAIFAHEGGLVALGSRHDIPALEIIRFSIGARGQLRQTSRELVHYMHTQLDAYRARLVNGKLVIYFRHPPLYCEGGRIGCPSRYALPALGPATLDAAPRILVRGRDVYQPLLHGGDVFLHTLLRCDLTAPELDCEARALLAPGTLEFELASDAAYLWLTAWRSVSAGPERSYVIRMPFDGSSFGAVRVTPPQASRNRLARATDGHLYASYGDASPDQLELFDIPLELFSPQASALPSERYRRMAALEKGPIVREDLELVGRNLLWGTKAGSIGGDLQPSLFLPTLQLIPLRAGVSTSVTLGHAATHALDLGDHLLVTGLDKWNLHMSLIALSEGPPHVVAKHVLRDAARKLSHYGPVLSLGSAGDGHWFAAEITRETKPGERPSKTFLPLHWTPDHAALEVSSDWSVPSVAAPHFQPVWLSHELLVVDSRLVLLRMQNQLQVLRFEPHSPAAPRIVQSFDLTP